jgi:multicomponent Na+:H+ antiporter subunit D
MADIFPSLPNLFFNALGWLAVLTMITGVLGAAYHWDIRRILAFHIISQIGYILLAVALGTKAGYGAAVFYTIHHIIVKANLFLVAGLVFQASGSYDLRTIGGLAIARPVLGLVFLIPALSLVGIPPLSGFWAKLLVIREAMYMQHYVWFGSALLVGLLTLYSMMKIGMEVFWKQAPEGLRIPPASHQNPKRHVTAYAVVIFLAALTVWIGLWPETLLQFSLQAVEQMTRDQ